MFKSILVLESTWDHESLEQISVWPFISEFANVKNLRAYYKTFSNKAALEHWVKLYNQEDSPRGKLLYIAAHGSMGSIAGLHANINGTTIRELLKQCPDIPYVHFGTCNFGSQRNLEKLLSEVDHLRWAIGYDQSINWIDSTLFDLMIWNRIAGRDPDDETIRARRAHTLVKELLDDSGNGLAKKLGFSFQYRYGDKVDVVS
jgi:hypothetical protein